MRALKLNVPTHWRLDGQIGWYDHKSTHNQQCYRLLKTAPQVGTVLSLASPQGRQRWR